MIHVHALFTLYFMLLSEFHLIETGFGIFIADENARIITRYPTEKYEPLQAQNVNNQGLNYLISSDFELEDIESLNAIKSFEYLLEPHGFIKIHKEDSNDSDIKKENKIYKLDRTPSNNGEDYATSEMTDLVLRIAILEKDQVNFVKRWRNIHPNYEHKIYKVQRIIENNAKVYFEDENKVHQIIISCELSEQNSKLLNNHDDYQFFNANRVNEDDTPFPEHNRPEMIQVVIMRWSDIDISSEWRILYNDYDHKIFRAERVNENNEVIKFDGKNEELRIVVSTKYSNIDAIFFSDISTLKDLKPR